MSTDTLLWALRVGLRALGAVLTAFGIGDETLWGEVAGVVLWAAAEWWGKRAMDAAKASVPAPVQEALAELREKVLAR
jgi:hypothetical protein